MLRTQLSQVELGFDPASDLAGLDVIQGFNFSSPAATAPILFPGPGVTTDLLEFGGEQPTPLETCGWQNLTQVGLPLIAMLPQDPAPGLTATVAVPGGRTESSATSDLCVVDDHTYASSDPTYGADGLDILQGDHAVLLIPRYALTNGPVSVTIQQPQQSDIAWSFTAYLPPPVNVSPPGISGTPVQGQTLNESPQGSWTNSPTGYAEQWERCDPTGSNCQAIAGATTQSYAITPVDVGSTLRIEEIAGNQGAPGTPATSAATMPVSAPLPTPLPKPVAPPSPRNPTGGDGTTPAYNAGGAAGAASPLRIALKLGVGRATLIAPTWTTGRPIRVAVYNQRLVCGGARRVCYWHTTAVTSRRLHVAGANTSFAIRRPSGRGRIRASVTLLAFSAGGWSYGATTVAGVEP
jgi:hypothetical protein